MRERDGNHAHSRLALHPHNASLRSLSQCPCAWAARNNRLLHPLSFTKRALVAAVVVYKDVAARVFRLDAHLHAPKQ